MAHTKDRLPPAATVSFSLNEQLDIAAEAIRAHIGDRKPTVGLVLGSGLGGYADQLGDAVALDYGDIPRFPLSTVAGHAGRLVVGSVSGTTCAAMQGRVQQARQALAHAARGLELLDPRVVLQRGYTWLTDAAGSTVTSVAQLPDGAAVRATLADGEADLQVTKTHRV